MAIQLPLFLNNRTRVRNLLYALIWGTGVLLNAYDPQKHSVSFDVFRVSFSIAFWITVWFEHAVVLTHYLNRRQVGWAFLGSIGALGCFIIVRYVIEQIIYWHVLGFSNYPLDVSWLYYAKDNLYYALPAVGLGFAFKIVEDWLVHQQERSELVSERNTAELAFLKSQVNPHFLFNTLNNIYSLAYTKSDAAPGAILKLSELMRYMLYDSNGQSRSTIDGKSERVSLGKEVTYLKNYVELEKLRVANANVLFTIEGNIDLFRIEPLLLVAFVENAFKHGELSDPEQPLVIELSVRNGKLRFDTLNKKAKRQTDSVGGIGLTNVRRRLELLYPKQHTLHITDESDNYASSLELTL
jgi:two-component system LytT family sensor kinase